MGVDIQYWFDNNLDFSTASDLRFQIARNMNKKICILYIGKENYMLENKDGNFNTYESYEDLKFYDFDYMLEIGVDDIKKVDLNENIKLLLKNDNISITLREINPSDDFGTEADIYDKSIILFSDNYSFGYRWRTFIQIITDPDTKLDEDIQKSLFRLNQFANIFNSRYLYLIPDSISEVGGAIEDKLYKGIPFTDALKQTENAKSLDFNTLPKYFSYINNE